MEFILKYCTLPLEYTRSFGMTVGTHWMSEWPLIGMHSFSFSFPLKAKELLEFILNCWVMLVPSEMNDHRNRQKT